MKKWLLLSLAVVIMSVGFLSACSSTPEPTPTPTPTATPNVPITITYATWGDKVKEQKIIDEFQKVYPYITVKIDETMDWPWDEKLAAAAAAGKFPDVLMLDNIPNGIVNGWLEDLTPYLAADKDYNDQLIYGNLSETTKYNGKQFALPIGLFAGGVYYNKALFEAENIEIPATTWTLDDMEAVAKKITKPSDYQYGIQGSLYMDQILAPQFNSDLGWGTYDGTKFNFDNAAWADSINWMIQFGLKDKLDLDSTDSSKWAEWYGGSDGWSTGKLGMYFWYSWDFPWFKDASKFAWDILPVPGQTSQRVPLITDYAGMSSSSEHKDAAFLFLKYYSYSKENWMNRIKNEDPIGTMPVITDEEVWAAYLASAHIPAGFKAIVDEIPNGFIDGGKWIPGFREVFEKAVNPHMDKFKSGEEKPEDVAADIQKQAMEIFEAAKLKVDNATK
jgi:multiple sugar transport system substrate-binding protein